LIELAQSAGCFSAGKAERHPVFVYNFPMLLSADLMRFLLLLCIIGLAFLAAFSLRGRSLSFLGYLGWGALIIFLPLIGPFLVILFRPGSSFEKASRN
jgi:hypothetical protein